MSHRLTLLTGILSEEEKQAALCSDYANCWNQTSMITRAATMGEHTSVSVNSHDYYNSFLPKFIRHPYYISFLTRPIRDLRIGLQKLDW